MTAERAFVVSATRIVGSGPATSERFRVGMTGVAADGAGHAGCVRRGRVSSRDCCWPATIVRNNDCASSKLMALRTRELRIAAACYYERRKENTDFQNRRSVV